MSDSQILSIYDAFQTMSITVGGKTPTVYPLTGTPSAVETAQLPCRILTVLDNRLQVQQARARTIVSNVTKPGMAVSWILADLLLWTPEAQGRGVRDVAETLVDYCGKYINAVRDNIVIIDKATLIDCRPAPDIYEYPTGSGNLYFAVVAVTTVLELMDAETT